MNGLTNTQLVLLGTSLLGCVAGVVGSFAVLRRRALVGDLLAHAALPGLCLAFLLINHRALAERAAGQQVPITHPWQFTAMLAGALVAGLVGVVAVTLICRWTRTKEDAAIGIVLGTFFGAGVVLSAWIQNIPAASSKAGLQTYIYGQAAGMTREDVWFITAVAAACLTVVTLLYKEFTVLSFDPGFARAQGWPTLAIDLTMMGTLAVVTVVGLPTVGVVLMAAMLIIPGAAARFWTDRLGRMLVVSGVIGAACGIGGTLISAGALEDLLGWDPLAFGHNTRNLPTGPVIVLCGTALFTVSILFAPRRGAVARWLRTWAVARRVGHENLLRSMYELSESTLPEPSTISVAQLTQDRAWSALRARRLLRWAARAGFVEPAAAGARLTAAGIDRARQIVRTHRLWELFLISGADIAPDHVDRDADSIEHYLSPELVARLEAEIAQRGRLPASSDALPDSPHHLAAQEPPLAGGAT